VKKLAFGLFGTLFAFFLILISSNSVFASEKEQSPKELAEDFLENKKLTEVEEQKLENYVVVNHDNVLKKIEKQANKKSSNMKKLKTLKTNDIDPIKQSEALEEIWTDLSEDEQLAYTVYSTPVELVEEIEEIELPNSNRISTLATPTNKTNNFISTVTGTNIYGKSLFVYSTMNTWVYNGIKIISKSPSENAIIKSAGWKYMGKDLETWSEYNNFDYYRNVDGHFEFRMVGMTYQTATVHFKTKIRANGNWSSTKSITKSWG
jgi:hypothetical protein